MNVKIANLRSTRIGVKCDRTSPLGNPFYMKSEAYRDVVCDAYNHYFELVVNQGWQPRSAATAACDKFLNSGCRRAGNFVPPNSRRTFMKALGAIGPDETLLCWCAVKRCHCETIADYIDSKAKFFQEVTQ